jgi:ubiquinol-cytochrome c reductase iron-sulfur subunit
VERLVEEGADGISRRGLLKLGLLGAGGTLGLAALVPALSFGPAFRIKELFATPWRKGRLLVDEADRPWKATDILEADFYTAFPAGADKEQQGSPLVLVRLPKDRLALPADLAGYDADGIVAYSKICTHAGCAISMYRVPLFQPDEPSPALVCPCHYSTFDPAKGGTVLFGPAGRRLPMLPLQIDAKGYLRAKGNFDEPVGPSWWGVRNRKPS